MAGGFRSFFAFWLGGASSFSFSLTPTPRFVLLCPILVYNSNLSSLVYNLVAVGGPGVPFFGKFPPISPAQKQTLSFDFGKFLPLGVTLTGTPAVTLSVVFGTDNSPSSRITAAPIIGTVSTVLHGSGVPNTAVLFQVSGCPAGVQYVAEVVCNRSDGDIAEGSAGLSSEAPGAA